ncbi:MAG: site-2 protease family protein [Anaerolineae bacterium]|nr:site-2 protease family protein [Anaerolineae bacterium]
MQGGFKIGRIFGINIRIDWSWLFIFALIVLNLSSVFAQQHPGWGTGIQWGAAIGAAVLFFASLLVHEVAHSLVAKSQGIPVRSITMFLFGGVSNIQREPDSPKAEFLITIVGPITSLVIGGVLLMIGSLSVGPLPATTLTSPTDMIGRLNPLSTMLIWVGAVNILLGFFNLIPGFPLDGGRIVRSIFWAITGDLRRSTNWASRIGQLISWAMIISGIAMVFGARIPFFGSGLINGLWLAFIGWFLNSAAIQSYRQVVIRDILEDVPVRHLMRSDPPTVAPNISVSQLIHDYVMKTDEHAFPVMWQDRMAGLVTLDDVRTVPRDAWDARQVRDIMTPADELIVASPEEEAAEALNKLKRRDVRQLPVLRENRLAGMLRRRDIVKWLQLQTSELAT